MVIEVFIPVSGMSCEELAHLAQVRDRYADLADLAAAQRAVGVVAGLRRQVEGDAEAGLALGQVGAVERVGRLGRGVAGVGAHHPGPVLDGAVRLASLGHGDRVGRRLPVSHRVGRVTDASARGDLQRRSGGRGDPLDLDGVGEPGQVRHPAHGRARGCGRSGGGRRARRGGWRPRAGAGRSRRSWRRRSCRRRRRRRGRRGTRRWRCGPPTCCARRSPRAGDHVSVRDDVRDDVHPVCSSPASPDARLVTCCHCS